MARTPFPPAEYDKLMRSTVPFYQEIHQQTLEVVRAYMNRRPVRWLEVGCGTGAFGEKILKSDCNVQELILSDNCTKMLGYAQERLANATGPIQFRELDTMRLPYCAEFDVITALFVHHYLQPQDRAEATRQCYNALQKGGLFLTVENICPRTLDCKKINLLRWQQFQVERGRTIDEAKEHVGRFGKDYHPITVLEHLNLMQEIGFHTVEVFWLSYLQAGFLGIK